MKQNIFQTVIAAMLLCVTFTSCSSVRWVSVDRLTPSKVDIPEQVRRVAVLNNQPYAADRKAVYYLNAGDVTDSLAQYLADVGYFDEVVLGDTLLGTATLVNQEKRTLRPVAVMDLCRKYGADMLLTVDNVSFFPEAISYPYVTGEVRIRMTCYQPGELKPLTTITDAIWMDWEQWPWLKHDAVIFAASSALSFIVPQWQVEEFPFYTGANVGQRDAAVYVREDNWDGASRLWSRQLNHKNRRRRMEAHLNMAVYHELKGGNMATARQYAEKARELASEKLEKQGDKVISPSSDYQLISDYLKDMERRNRNLERIKRQMHRFSDDF